MELHLAPNEVWFPFQGPMRSVMAEIFLLKPFAVPITRTPHFSTLSLDGAKLDFRPWSPFSFSKVVSNERGYCKDNGLELPSTVFQIASCMGGGLLLSEVGIGAYMRKKVVHQLEDIDQALRKLKSEMKGIPKKLNDIFEAMHLKIGHDVVCILIRHVDDKIVNELMEILEFDRQKLTQIKDVWHYYGSRRLHWYFVGNLRRNHMVKVRNLVLFSIIYGYGIDCSISKLHHSLSNDVPDLNQLLVLLHWRNPFVIAGYTIFNTILWGSYLHTVRFVFEKTQVLNHFVSKLIMAINNGDLDASLIDFARALYTVPSKHKRKYSQLVVPIVPLDLEIQDDWMKVEVVSILDSQMQHFVEGSEKTSFLTVSRICELLGDKKRRKTQVIRDSLEYLARLGIVKRKPYTGPGSRKHNEEKNFMYSIALDNEKRKEVLIDYINEILNV